MAKGGRPRLRGPDPQNWFTWVRDLAGSPRGRPPHRPAQVYHVLDHQPRGLCVALWQGHSHLGLHNASDPRVSPRFLAED